MVGALGFNEKCYPVLNHAVSWNLLMNTQTTLVQTRPVAMVTGGNLFEGRLVEARSG